MDNPVAPRKKLYLVAGAMLGGLLAAAIALLLEALDQSVKTVEEAKLYFNLPVLGGHPISSLRLKAWYANEDTDDRLIPRLVVCTESNSLGSESYHMLRSNLKFLNSDNPPKVLVVTSSLPKRG